MKVKFYGVRGSYPVPGPSTVKYGGNTTCVSVYQEDKDQIKNRIIIDFGTGGIVCGKEIIGNYFAKKESLNPVTVLFTHLHPDHMQGFPFAAFNYFPECMVDVYGMCTLQKEVEDVLEQQQMPPVFPVEYRDLKSFRTHRVLKDGSTFFVGNNNSYMGERHGLRVDVMQAYAPSHPQQGALYYRITEEPTGKSVTCIWDNESKVGGDKAVIRFAKDSDVMIHDTQYTHDEYIGTKPIVQGFGHSTYEMALDDAAQAHVKRLVCMHYNPSHDDDRLDAIQTGTNVAAEIGFILAKEGMVLDI
jgi:phosphoribosyl 1,2-cyclic phosphodiesterase